MNKQKVRQLRDTKTYEVYPWYRCLIDAILEDEPDEQAEPARPYPPYGGMCGTTMVINPLAVVGQ